MYREPIEEKCCVDNTMERHELIASTNDIEAMLDVVYDVQDFVEELAMSLREKRNKLIEIYDSPVMDCERSAKNYRLKAESVAYSLITDSYKPTWEKLLEFRNWING